MEKRIRNGTVVLSTVTALAVSCSSPAPKEPDVDVTRLTEQAYSLKKRGDNRKALAVLAKAQEIIVSGNGADSPEAASNLDDQASIYMRTGDFERARGLFLGAREILERSTASDPNLLSGVTFRLFILGELERQGIVCKEPLDPVDSPSTGPADRFPDMASMHRAMGKLNPTIAGCHDGPPRPIDVRVVVTGTGKIVAAKVFGPPSGSHKAGCVERGLVSPTVDVDLPNFKACFISFTFPFKVGKAQQEEQP